MAVPQSVPRSFDGGAEVTEQTGPERVEAALPACLGREFRRERCPVFTSFLSLWQQWNMSFLMLSVVLPTCRWQWCAAQYSLVNTMSLQCAETLSIKPALNYDEQLSLPWIVDGMFSRDIQQQMCSMERFCQKTNDENTNKASKSQNAQQQCKCFFSLKQGCPIHFIPFDRM